MTGEEMLGAWDVHSSLNAIAQGVIPLSERDSAPFYALGEHLKAAAQVVKAGNWVSPSLLSAWIVSFVELRLILKRQPGEFECTVNLPRGIQIGFLPVALLVRAEWREEYTSVSIALADERSAIETGQTLLSVQFMAVSTRTLSVETSIRLPHPK